jgi:hypothetical protein
MTLVASQTYFGKNEPFNLQVSRGQIPNHRAVTVFGYNGDVDTSEETIWPQGGILAYPSAALQMKVSSNNANDTANGTGARTVLISGLVSDYSETSETVTLNGQTAVTTTTAFLRINNAYVLTAGSSNSAEGNIYIGTGTVTAGVPATIYDTIHFDYNARVTGSYTIPANYTAYLVAGSLSSAQASGATAVTGRLIAIGLNKIRTTYAIVSLNNGFAPYDFVNPIAIPEKTTVEAAAFGAAANNIISSYFNFTLIKNTTL